VPRLEKKDRGPGHPAEGKTLEMKTAHLLESCAVRFTCDRRIPLGEQDGKGPFLNGNRTEKEATGCMMFF